MEKRLSQEIYQKIIHHTEANNSSYSELTQSCKNKKGQHDCRSRLNTSSFCGNRNVEYSSRRKHVLMYHEDGKNEYKSDHDKNIQLPMLIRKPGKKCSKEAPRYFDHLNPNTILPELIDCQLKSTIAKDNSSNHRKYDYNRQKSQNSDEYYRVLWEKICSKYMKHWTTPSRVISRFIDEENESNDSHHATKVDVACCKTSFKESNSVGLTRLTQPQTPSPKLYCFHHSRMKALKREKLFINSLDNTNMNDRQLPGRHRNVELLKAKTDALICKEQTTDGNKKSSNNNMYKLHKNSYQRAKKTESKESSADTDNSSPIAGYTPQPYSDSEWGFYL